MVEVFNIKTREWNKPVKIPSNKQIEDIVGKNTPIKVDSNGNIEIDKILTQQEKSAIEAL